MPVTTSGNPQDDPARTQESTPAPPASHADNLDELAQALGLVPRQPLPAEVEAPPSDKDLTGEVEECQNPVEMPAKEAPPGRADPALQEAFDAFDGAKLPRPALTKLTGMTPEEGLDALREVVKYLDSVADPVAKVVQLILSDLSGQSFENFAGTKEWGSLVQWILERTGYAALCPKCSEPARIDTASHRSSDAGSIRFRHARGGTHGGSGTLPDTGIIPIDRPE
jgi:hypothetical protein